MAKSSIPLTQERLKQLLDYNQETGVFTGHNNGHPIGWIENGYVRINVNGRKYQAHRLAWLYVYGEWPPDEVDHQNRRRSDNRIINIRSATKSLNMRNLARTKLNRSGFKGVTWHAEKQKWRASIWLNGRQAHLGYFSSPQSAHAAYCAAAKSNFGDFARFE